MSRPKRKSYTNTKFGQLRDMDFIAVDPGVNYFGWALFVHGRVTHVGVDRAHDAEERLSRRMIIERPIIRQNSPVDPRDILDLAVMAERYAGHSPEVFSVEPQDWKGTVNGDVFLNRVRAALDGGAWGCDALAFEQGLAKLTKANQSHALDAYALGMWAVGKRP